MSNGTYRQLAIAVLVAHQRRDSESCLCGWSELGQSHAEHVATILEAAGALRNKVPADEDDQAPTHRCLCGCHYIANDDPNWHNVTREEAICQADHFYSENLKHMRMLTKLDEVISTSRNVVHMAGASIGENEIAAINRLAIALQRYDSGGPPKSMPFHDDKKAEPEGFDAVKDGIADGTPY